MSLHSEELILVDEEDRPIGRESKVKCHEGQGLLHRAFSVFIFNSAGELLLQQRSSLKPLWPLSWSNTVCSHPRFEEETIDAAHRRLTEEVGMKADLQFLYKFNYSASYRDFGSEREVCHVFAGISDEEIKINPNEVASTRWVSMEAVAKEIRENPENFTPWFKMEIKEIMDKFSNIINQKRR